MTNLKNWKESDDFLVVFELTTFGMACWRRKPLRSCFFRLRSDSFEPFVRISAASAFEQVRPQSDRTKSAAETVSTRASVCCQPFQI
jgi:hypothetical protein